MRLICRTNLNDQKKKYDENSDGPRKKDWHNYQQIAEEAQRKGNIFFFFEFFFIIYSIETFY